MPQASNTCLLVVDVQNLLVNEHPYQEQEMLETIRRLLMFCRKSFIEVIYVRHGEDEEGGLMPHSEAWQIHESVAPLAGERIFDKTRSSSFYKTGLKEYLGEKGIETLIITGMQTDFCINATVQAGFEHGFELLIPENGNSTYDNRFMTAEHTLAYYQKMIWNGRFGTVLSVDAIEKLFS